MPRPWASSRPTSSASWPIRRSPRSAIMFIGLGVGAYAAGIFHLMTHAFFKSLLFLAAGSVIHALSGEQDMRKMGGLRGRIPADLSRLPRRGAGHLRHPGALRLLLQGRDPGFGLRLGELSRLGPRPRRRGHDRFLHVPSDLPDLLRRGAAFAAEAVEHVHESPPVMLVPLRDPGLPRRRRRLHRPAPRPRGRGLVRPLPRVEHRRPRERASAPGPRSCSWSSRPGSPWRRSGPRMRST